LSLNAIKNALLVMREAGLNTYGNYPLDAKTHEMKGNVYWAAVQTLGIDTKVLPQAIEQVAYQFVATAEDFPSAGQFRRAIARWWQSQFEQVGVSTAEGLALVKVRKGLNDTERHAALESECRRRGIPAPLPPGTPKTGGLALEDVSQGVKRL
jgi:hypothetical protein